MTIEKQPRYIKLFVPPYAEIDQHSSQNIIKYT